MEKQTPDFVLGQIADPVRPQAEALGLTQEACLFCMRSDLDVEGRLRDVWLIVTKTRLAAVAADDAEARHAVGPFQLEKVQKARIFQTVGSAFLQGMVGGLYVDLVRSSNGRREVLDRARRQLDRILAGDEMQAEALSKPSEQVCQKCGLPLPGRGMTCLRCGGGGGIFWRAMALMKPYRGYVVLLLLLMIVRVALNLVPPYLVKTLVDDVLTSQKRGPEWLLWLVLALLAVHVLGGALAVCIGRASVYIGTRITSDLRVILQRKLLELSVEYYDRNSVGGLMSRVLYDVEMFRSFVDQVAGGFLLNIMTVLGIGCMLFFLNAKLAILVLLPIPLVLAYTVFYWKHIYPLYYPVYDSQSKMSQLVSGILSGIRLVKAFGQEEREMKRFEQTSEYMQDNARKLGYSTSVFNALMPLLMMLGSLIIWYAGGKQVLAHVMDVKTGMTLGTLMAFFSYVGMFYGPVQALAMLSSWATGFMSAAQRVFEVLDARVSLGRPANPVPVDQLKGRIELKNVSFGYDPHTPILKNVSMTIEPGRFIGIVGKSGSGKTTLVNLICRFYDPQDGEVLIDGINVLEMDPEKLHRQVALVLQEPFLFRASIRDNLAYGKPSATPGEVMHAARSANAHDFIAARPGAYDRRLGERGAGLSGGERQRVTIARALIDTPRILILDEATSSVDTESELEIQKALARVGKGRTTIVIAHRLSTLKSADYIYVMDEGRIAESGSHEELMEKKGIYERLVRIQTELTRLEAH